MKTKSSFSPITKSQKKKHPWQGGSVSEDVRADPPVAPLAFAPGLPQAHLSCSQSRMEGGEAGRCLLLAALFIRKAEISKKKLDFALYLVD